MTMARRAVTARSDMRTAIRAEVRDPATDRSGQSVASAILRWANSEIDTAFNMALEELANEVGVQHPGGRLLSVDTTYTASSDDIALPSGELSFDGVYKVENIADTSHPLPIEYVSPLEIERFAVSSQARVLPWTSYRYTLVARDLALRIAIRPRPSADIAIRISYLAPAVITADDADTHPSTSHWYEFLVLCAAGKLLRPDDEFSSQQFAELERQRQFLRNATAQAGPQRIRTRRRFR